MILSTKEQSEIYELLHKLWGKARENPNYEKWEWKNLKELLDKAIIVKSKES